MASSPSSSWISYASYWHPPRVFLSAWLEHAPFAYWLMNAHRPSVVVELGTHTGFSFFVFCEAARRLGTDTHVSAIDTWVGDDHAGFYDESVFESVRAGQQEYASGSTLLRGFFSDYVDAFDDGSIDLLHIDGRHGYDDVREDFESWLPKVSQGGIILFHDTAEHGSDFGVWKLWDEISALYPSFAFVHGHGLGVIGVGRSASPEVRGLLSADPGTTGQIRDFYESVGGAISAAWSREEGSLRAIGLLEDEIAQLRSSNSWRFTKPFRTMMNRIRGRG